MFVSNFGNCGHNFWQLWTDFENQFALAKAIMKHHVAYFT